MKNKCLSIFLLVIIWGLSACIDDKNNYNYIEVNELKENISGMKDEYLLSYEEELTITPTFKFSIDSIKPDVSYEWRLDEELLVDETGPSCIFCFTKGGQHEVTFSVIDNKTGVKFSRSTTLVVRSPFARGWVLLKEGDSQESIIDFVGARSVMNKMMVFDGKKMVEIERDSLVYDLLINNVSPSLGKHPKGLFLNAGYAGSETTVDIKNEVGVIQDRWVELNGNTMERSVYTEDEFYGDLPEVGFDPLMAAMTYSAKAILNVDGHIYWANMSYVSDYHSCAYTSFPLGKKLKFLGLYPSFRLNVYHGAMPALTEDNEIVGIIDEAEVPYGKDQLKPSLYSSGVYSVNGDMYDPTIDNRYKLGSAELLSIYPASYDYTSSDAIRPSWVAIVKEGGSYQLIHFQWEVGRYPYYNRLSTKEFTKLPIVGLSAFTEMAVFNVKQYVVLAEGANLWYFQYGVGEKGTLKKLHTFTSPIKSIAANDINVWGDGTELTKPIHDGQLGVALEDGTFFIFGVVEKKENPSDVDIKHREKLTMDVSLKQLFPDPNAEKPLNNQFGKIVDVLYKQGSVKEFVSFIY